MAAQIQQARRTGLTFAPEAGSWRMRQVINKLITEEDLYGAVDSAFSQGWRRVKLYFLTGLPTETDEDTLGIVELAERCVQLAKAKGHNGSVTVSVGGFVPKAFTPFQWFGMNTEEELRRKVNLLRDAARKAKGVQLKWHDPRASLVEGLVSRGDRRLGPVIEHVWRAGGTFQEWSEHFRLDLWQEAMEAHGLDMDWYCHRHRTEDEVLPWDHLSAGLHKDFLWQDWRRRARRGRPRGLPVDAVLRLRRLHGLRHRARGRLRGAARRRQPGHRPGPRPRRRGAGHAAPPQARGGRRVKQRVRFTKLGKIRFLSHRDLARIWERSLRRSGVQVAYSEGFSPRPRLSFGLALSTGHESLGEYLDIDLAEDLDPADLPGIVTPSLPEGHDGAGRHRDPAGHRFPPAGRHQLQLAGGPARRRAGGDRGRHRPRAGARELPIEVERKGTPVTFDARPAILAIPADGGLTAELATQPRSLRPAELLRALDPHWGEGRVLRTHQWTLVDGARCEPIPFGDPGARGATSTPHTGARA